MGERAGSELPRVERAGRLVASGFKFLTEGASLESGRERADDGWI